MTRFLQEHSTRTGPVWPDIIVVLSCAIKKDMLGLFRQFTVC